MFILEDGTGLEDSNSYVDEDEFRAYFLDRGTDYTATVDATIQAALIRATDYIDTNNREAFRGYPLVVTQALCFPRSCLYSTFYPYPFIEGIPVRLKYATIEYAKRALTGELQPDPEINDSGQLVLSHSEAVGPIKESFTFSEAGILYTIRPYPSADNYLSEFLSQGGHRTIRA